LKIVPLKVWYGFLFAFNSNYVVSFQRQSEIFVENRDFSYPCSRRLR